MSSSFDPETPVESYHPGHTRFVRVGEPIHDSVFVIDADDTALGVDVEIDQGGRDNLAPRLPDLSVDPENYDDDDFEWSVVSTPEESDGEVLSFATSKTEIIRYDAGADNAAEFVADVPGEYVLGLDAPDGQHELTLYAFPEGTGALVLASNSTASTTRRASASESNRTRTSRRRATPLPEICASSSSRTTGTHSRRPTSRSRMTAGRPPYRSQRSTARRHAFTPPPTTGTRPAYRTRSNSIPQARSSCRTARPSGSTTPSCIRSSRARGRANAARRPSRR
ncbi:hypothetical protein ACFQH2_15040 [Natronoarchaeum sp. GCM10025703]|uniref:hypothetical protein n=1 Tax=Natronoarchaeum sp. GCM10025703 TaxID=3252685 RepID=UPI00360CAC20